MNEGASAQVLALLRELRDGQQQALSRQAEALTMQRAQIDLVRRQAERNERIQQRAEELQERGAGMMAVARRVLMVPVPVVIALIVYVSWLLFR